MEGERVGKGRVREEESGGKEGEGGEERRKRVERGREREGVIEEKRGGKDRQIDKEGEE